MCIQVRTLHGEAVKRVRPCPQTGLGGSAPGFFVRTDEAEFVVGIEVVVDAQLY